MPDPKDINTTQDHIDSDMVDPDIVEDHNDDYMNDVDGSENNSENYLEHSDNESENESLQRLSDQIRRRRDFDNAFDDYDDEDDMVPADFLRRLISARSRSARAEEDNEEDDEDEDPRSEFLRAMGALSSGSRRDASERGQGFVDVVQRLMGGDIIFGGRDNGEMEGLINNLNQRDDTYIILETLNELSERLLMMNGITAERIIPANKLAKSLVNIMEDPKLSEELELHLVACRCLYNFLEVNQDFIHDALHNNAVETLCGKLLEISYIDLTEQALQALEMISRDPISHNQIIVSNGLKACLQYLDFLTIHAQRKCLIIVANACTNIRISNFNMIKDVFDNISEVVRNHSDSVVIENAWLAISRIIMSFKSRPELLEELFLNKESLLKELKETIYISCNKSSNTDESGKTPLNFTSCLSLIKSLIILASISVEISRILLSDCVIGEVIVKSLNKYSKTKTDSTKLETTKSSSRADDVSIEALMAAPKELLSQFLNLISYLLPITNNSKDTPYMKNFPEGFEEKQKINELRVELCEEIIPESYWKLVNDVWSLLINSYQATMDYELRRKILINLNRIISFGDGEDFQKINNVAMITGLLASIINQSKGMINKSFNKQDDIDMSENEEEDQEDYDEEVEEAGEKSEDAARLNSNILLLSAFIISKNLIEKAPFLFIYDFEREGLFSDTMLILKNLNSYNVDDEINESNRYSQNHSKEHIDIEFAKDYEKKLTSSKIYTQLANVGKNIENLCITLKSAGDSTNIPEHMSVLEEIKNILNEQKLVKSFNYDSWRGLWNQLQSILSSANKNSRISSFELISSGIIESLSFIFTSDSYDFGFEFNDCYKAFIGVFFIDGSEDSSVSFLVNKLQEALTRSESFEIISSGGSNSSFPSYHQENNHTAAMARQVKIKLTLEDKIEENKLPAGMQNMILSVHAIATFKSIDTFLKQRFRFIEEFHGLDEDEDDSEVDEEINLNRSNNESNRTSMNIEFLINGEVIPNETTIYGAIYRSLQGQAEQTIDSSKIWSNVHNVTFRKVSSAPPTENKPTLYNLNINETELEIYDKTTISILKLLKILFEMNTHVKNTLQNGKSISDDNFMNWKLTVKLNRQLEEPLVVASGTLPGWSIHVTKQFPFIFPLDTRIFFLQSTSFGYSRLIHHWQIRTNQEGEDHNNSSSNINSNQRPQLGRPTRHKVRLSRKSILQSAMKVLGLYGSTPGVLEIEYFDEVGSGLGPTLEFYATVSKEFSKKKLRLWRDQDTNNKNEEDYISSKTGLFPAPLDKSQISSENGRKVLFFFSSLGKFIARALLDSRIIDFNFNPVFFKLVQYLNQNDSQKSSTRDLKNMANLTYLRLVDPNLADSIEHLLKYVKQFPNIEEKDRDTITIDGSTLEDLSLYFVLPGYPQYEIIPNGEDVPITSSNLELYVNKVLEATLYTGIIHQTKAFMDGFSKVFPISSLLIFSPQELVELFGNADEDWSYETLTAAIHANHGYTKESVAIKRLTNILVKFDDIEKRAFLQFLTGAPKLPIGGFKALRPEFTVVRKSAEDGLKDDDYLPSVMTCANYLKLPSYSSEEVMKKKLLQAVNEGAGAFLLS